MDMPRDEDAACSWVEAAVAAMILRVAEEDAGDGVMVQLVTLCSLRVGVAEAAENTQVTVVGSCAEEQLVRCARHGGAARTTVEKKRRRAECLCPEPGGNGGMEEKCSHAVVERPQDPFCFAVLLASVRAREAQD